jgi:hypothetical protein
VYLSSIEKLLRKLCLSSIEKLMRRVLVQYREVASKLPDNETIYDRYHKRTAVNEYKGFRPELIQFAELEYLAGVTMKSTINLVITPRSWKKPAFRRNILPPFFGSNGKPSKKPTCSRPQTDLCSCLTYSSTLKMEAICFRETSAFFQTTRR